MRRPNPLILILLVAVFVYLAVAGATFNAVLTLLDIQALTLVLLAISVVAWRIYHRQQSWQWFRTPLDAVFVLWGVAFLVSILSNPLTWRRSAEALWYIGLYVGIWYMLLDLIANNAIRRRTIIDALLITGAVAIFFGYLQVILIFSNSGDIPRPVGTIGNTNAYGAFLLFLVPFALVQALQSKRRIARITMSLYTLSALILLFLTTSRGAWIGTGAALAAVMVLWLAHQDLLSVAKLRHWWLQQPVRIKRVVQAATLTAALAIIGVIVVFIMLLNESGRQLYYRTYIWDAALSMFTESPLSGQGLFTFGHHLALHDSIPPGQPHAHAHSVPLTVAAELGLVGLAALLASLIVGLWLMWRNWRTVKRDQRPEFIAASAALIGFGTHHLIDTPSMMPLIALMGALVLALALTPYDPQPMQSRWRSFGHPIGMAVLWVLILAVGFWHHTVYRDYIHTLRTALETENYAEMAQQMQRVVDADPRQPAYINQQAFLYAFAAHQTGDLEAARASANAFEQFLVLEPYDATNWANLAGLYWQLGQTENALIAIERAIVFAPNWTAFRQQQAIYTGDRTATDTTPEEAFFWNNRPHFQYLRDIMPYQFVPQVGYGSRP